MHLRIAVGRAVQEGDLRLALESRQRIGQAVGVLMERHRTTPDAAFAELARWSQHRNLKLREVAHFVVETGLDPDQMPVS